MKYLVKQSSDWCDEFTANCFRIFDDKQHAQEFIEGLVECGGYFGTNEGWEENELDEVDFTIQSITEAQAEVLVELLGKSFGTGLL